jgi:hypothetical protein
MTVATTFFIFLMKCLIPSKTFLEGNSSENRAAGNENRCTSMTFEVLTAISMNMALFSYAVLSSVVDIDRRFRGM